VAHVHAPAANLAVSVPLEPGRSVGGADRAPAGVVVAVYAHQPGRGRCRGFDVCSDVTASVRGFGRRIHGPRYLGSSDAVVTTTMTCCPIMRAWHRAIFQWPGESAMCIPASRPRRSVIVLVWKEIASQTTAMKRRPCARVTATRQFHWIAARGHVRRRPVAAWAQRTRTISTARPCICTPMGSITSPM